jgi:hypothetical protein
MHICDNCGRTRKQGDAFCTGCGRSFADDDPQLARPDSASGTSEPLGPHEPVGPRAPAGPYEATEPQRPAGPYGPAESYGSLGSYGPTETHGPAGSYGSADPYSGPSDRSRRSRTGVAGLIFRPAVVATVVVLFAAAAAASGALLYVRHHASHGEAVRNSLPSTQTTPPAQGSSGQDASASGQGGASPTQSPSGASSSPSGGSAVTIGPGASQDQDASSVAAFLGQYFAAINAHDYQSYISLLSPQVQQGMTQAQFDKGYRSTVDSNETLVGISTASDGDLAAEVTFTSHQNPADSPDQSESCTNWDVTLFLAQGGSGYVIDPAPSDYQASYQSCS